MALRLRAPHRPLLARCRQAARRPGRRRPERAAGGRPLRRRARARVARLRRRVPCPPKRPARGGRGRRPRDAVGLRGRAALCRAGLVPPGRRDARNDHGGERLPRDHPRTLGARPREAGGARAGSGSGSPGEAAVGAQQLPDAAGGLHDAGRSLPARLRAAARLARPARDLRARRRDPALLQPLAHRAAAVVDPRRGRGRSGRARGGARSRRHPRRQPSPTTRSRRASSPSAARPATRARRHHSASGSRAWRRWSSTRARSR